MMQAFQFLLYLVAMGLWWLAMGSFLGWLAGWSKMAKLYAGPDPGWSAPVSSRGWVSAKIGWVNYNHCLRLSIHPEGLVLRLSPRFLVGHPQLYIPREALEKVKWSRILGLFPCFQCKAQGTSLAITGGSANALKSWWEPVDPQDQCGLNPESPREKG